MPGNASRRQAAQIVGKRREIVAELMGRGQSSRQIASVMGAEPPPGFDRRWFFRNPVTGQPWNHDTINEDMRALIKEWRETAARKVAECLASQLAELREARKRAWEKDRIDLVISSILAEARLTGTLAPKRLKMSGEDGKPVGVVHFYQVAENGRDQLPASTPVQASPVISSTQSTKQREMSGADGQPMERVFIYLPGNGRDPLPLPTAAGQAGSHDAGAAC